MKNQLKLSIRNHPTRRNPEKFETIEVAMDPALALLVEAFADECGMSTEAFGSMIVDEHRARQN